MHLTPTPDTPLTATGSSSQQPKSRFSARKPKGVAFFHGAYTPHRTSHAYTLAADKTAGPLQTRNGGGVTSRTVGITKVTKLCAAGSLWHVNNESDDNPNGGQEESDNPPLPATANNNTTSYTKW